MGIWDKLLRKIVEPIVDESIKDVKSKELDQNVNKLLALNTRATALVTSSDSKSVAQRSLPAGVDYRTLRDFADYYSILRACINYRKRQITQLSWDVAPVKVLTDKKEREKAEKECSVIRDRLKFPAGDKSMTFRTFVSKIIEDMLVLDAVAVYKRKKKNGEIYGFLPIDASTIELVLNPDGTTPIPPNIAYQQKIGGEVVEEMSMDQMHYGLMNPRTSSPYGLSPVEALILTVTSALKLASYNLAYITEGNVPEGFVELPKDVANNPEQLQLWQEAWDAMFSGDVRFQRKIKFLPEGMKWSPIRKQSDMEFERFEKWLLLQTASVMEVAPQAIGFQFERGKGATESEWEIGKERGLYPTAHFLKEIFDEIIQNDFGRTDMQFVWTNINPTNKKEESDVFGQLVRTGAVSVDEWRIAEGFEPIGLGHYIMTPVGPVLVKDFVKMSESGENPFIPDYGSSTEGPSRNKNPNEAITPKKPILPAEKSIKDKLETITKSDIAEELKRWKKAAKNDIKQGKGFRDFVTHVIDQRTQDIIKSGLKTVTKKEEIDELFKPFVSQENSVIGAVLDLYEEVNDIVEYENKQTKQNQT